MNRRDKNELAAQALQRAKHTTASGFARANCPFCEHELGKADGKACLAISMTTGWFGCWRCDVRGRLDGYEDVEPRERAELPAGVMDPPEGFVPLYEQPGSDALCTELARQYLRSRGVSSAVVAEACVGCCLDGFYSDRVVVPVLDAAGGWQGWVARTWGRAEPKYLTAPGMRAKTEGGVFNVAALSVETDDPVIVVEGVFDALPYWPDAVALLGKPSPPQRDTLAAANRPVVVALDGDAWEEGWAFALALKLLGARAGSVRLPGAQDPGSVETAWLRERALACLA